MEEYRQDGRICLITGATSGLGYALAEELARRGAMVVLLCRNAQRGERVRKRIVARTGNAQIELLIADLADPAAVRQAADDFKRRFGRLHVLANFGGVSYPRHVLTAQGFELNFAVNLLGTFLLTRYLLDVLEAGAPAQIVNTVGKAHRKGRLVLENLQGAVEFRFMPMAAQWTLGRVLLSFEMARRYRRLGIAVNAFDPGWVRTRLHRHMPWVLKPFFVLASLFFARSARKAVRPMADLLTDPSRASLSGQYFAGSKAVIAAPVAYDASLSRQLWDHLLDAAGLEPLILPD
ncbi:MAG: SDR family NAD(P)-dependent oxidoreductase [Bacteroidia bacterium]